MRISDWSSDVCSSDLCGGFGVAATRGRDLRIYAPKIEEPPAQTAHALGLRRIPAEQSVGRGGRGAKEAAERDFGQIFRKDHRSAVEEKSDSVRVAFCGRRRLVKK